VNIRIHGERVPRVRLAGWTHTGSARLLQNDSQVLSPRSSRTARSEAS
jgi:hypothetical protein